MTINNNAKRTVEENSLLSVATDIKPIGVIYNVTNKTISNFVRTLLEDKLGIQGVEDVVIKVRQDGNIRPDATGYIFFNKRSADIIGEKRTSICNPIAEKMRTSTSRPSEKLKKALSSLCVEPRLTEKSGYAVAKLDLIRVLSLMLSSNPSMHKLIVSEIVVIDKGLSIMTVIKSERFRSAGGNSNNKFERIADSLS